MARRLFRRLTVGVGVVAVLMVLNVVSILHAGESVEQRALSQLDRGWLLAQVAFAVSVAMAAFPLAVPVLATASTAIFVAFVAVVATDVAHAPWIAAQLVKSLCPWTSPLAAEAEAWAWARWDAERQGVSIAPDAVPELDIEPGAAAPSLSHPWIIRGLLNASATAVQSKALRDYSWLLESPVRASGRRRASRMRALHARAQPFVHVAIA